LSVAGNKSLQYFKYEIIETAFMQYDTLLFTSQRL